MSNASPDRLHTVIYCNSKTPSDTARPGQFSESKRLPFLLIYILLFACQHDIWQHLQIATELVSRRQNHRRVARSTLWLWMWLRACVAMTHQASWEAAAKLMNAKEWQKGGAVVGPGLGDKCLWHCKSDERGRFKMEKNKSKEKSAACKDDRVKFTQLTGLGLLICI